MKLEFVNHASVVIAEGDKAILTDPWYAGPAFHKGWSLLLETPDDQVRALLSRVTDIWLSHEHPDHFSVKFFKDFGDILRSRQIPVWFQKTKDQRVAAFLRAEGIEVREMTFGESYHCGPISLTCYKDDWYDSFVSFKSADQHILNLNDCHIDSPARAREVLKTAGACDILLTQFSYAAWKGGPENRAWREAAAQEKLDNIALQANLLAPRIIVPFASFVRFNNAANTYLNDAANQPRDVMARFDGADFDLVFLQPGDVLDGPPAPGMGAAAVAFWQSAFEAAERSPPWQFETKSRSELEQAFDAFAQRIDDNNSRWFMRLAQRFSPVRVFQPVVVDCADSGLRLRVDPARLTLEATRDDPHLSMHSESLWFLFKFPFGFDTLTVNGCFHEETPGGFARAAKSLSIEVLNNMGIRFGPGIVAEPQLIRSFLGRLWAVRRRLEKVEKPRAGYRATAQ